MTNVEIACFLWEEACERGDPASMVLWS